MGSTRTATKRLLGYGGAAVAAAAALFAAVVVAAAPASAQTAAVDTSGLAAGPYSTMHAKVERTIFNVDVIRVVVRFDQPTQQRIASLARGKSFSTAISKQIAVAASQAPNAFAQTTFLRNVSVDEYVREASKDLARAAKAGMLSQSDYQAAVSDLRKDFASIKARGFHEGDRLLYRVRPDSVRKVVVSSDGKVLVDKTATGSGRAHAVLDAYFAPGSTLRDRLIKSIF